MLSYQKDVLMTEFAATCLGHLLSFVALIINKLNSRIDGFETRLRFERHILKSQNSNPKGVELLP